jgi:hypothetical protein
MRNLLLFLSLFMSLSQMAWANSPDALYQQSSSFYAYAYGNDPTCPNFNNGSADVIVFGAVAPISYLWSNGATTDSLRNLSQGTYTVTITDGTGSSVRETVTLSNTSGIYPSIEINRQPGCPSFNNGEMGIYAVYGGVAPYTYRWSNGATTTSINNLTEGNYSITVTDANGCTGTSDFTLLNGSGYVSVTPIDFPSCPNFNNGILEVDYAYNLTPPFTYLWNTGATTQRISNLTQGSYEVTVTDINGCKAEQVGFLYDTNIYTYIAINQAPTCPSYNNGSIVAYIYGGVAPFTYLWNNGATTETLSNLTEGDYSVTITDANGCTTQSTQYLVNSTPLVYVQTLKEPTCPNFNDGVIEFAAFYGGIAPYTFLWSNGATTSSISNLTQGNYTLTATDANGCQAVQSTQLFNASLFVYAGATHQPTCPTFNNGSATVFQVANGVAPFTYLWSNGSTTATINDLTEGFYGVTVSDANGCQGVAAAHLVKSNPFYANLVINQNVSCGTGTNSGEVEVESIYGGIAPYTYLWNNGATTSLIGGLGTGTYTVTITDGTGCAAEFSIPLINQGLHLFANATQEPTCPNFNNGVAEVISIFGGVAPYTYLWSNGATTSTITNLTNGVYTVTVTDSGGCTGEGITYLFGSTPFVFTTPVQMPTCPNFNNGEAEVLFAFNAVPPFSYQWSNGATTASATNLTAGVHFVTFTDASGCSVIDSVMLFDSGLMPIIGGTDPTCPNNNDGSIELLYTLGGTAPYTYLWSNGATTTSLNNLPLGNYFVTVTDATGCTGEGGIGLFNTSIWSFTYPIQQPNCANSNDGSAGVFALGHAPFTYLWSTGATTDTIGGVAPGTYFVTVTDFKGCAIVDSIILYPLMNGGTATFNFVVQGNTAHFHSSSSYAMYMTWNFGDGHTMNNLNHTPSHTYTQAGTYTVTLTCQDSCGNTTSRTATVDIGNFVSLDAKVFLQANYNPTIGFMDDFIRSSDLIPLNEPYSATYNHISNSNETVTKAVLDNTTFPAVVDWIFVELRDATNPSNLIATRAGLLLQNGKIVDTDAISALRFSNVQPNDYYVAVRHRNHLGFRTASSIPFAQTITNLDFTTSAIALNGTIPMATNNGIRMMISGDANSDGSIDAFDTIMWENQNGTFDNYDRADYNLDGSVDAFDSVLWELNNGKFEELD